MHAMCLKCFKLMMLVGPDSDGDGCMFSMDQSLVVVFGTAVHQGAARVPFLQGPCCPRDGGASAGLVPVVWCSHPVHLGMS